MHNNSQKLENEARGRRAEMKPVDDAVNISEEAVTNIVKESAPVSGIVVNCLKLNVRREPKVDGEIITTIPALTEVIIDSDASGRDFYKVYTSDGVEGFCMKKYIAFKQ